MDRIGEIMKIGIDLDNVTASRQSIEFFEILTQLLDPDHKIYILTDREPDSEQDVANELDYLGIEYAEIAITADKEKYLKDKNITIFFESGDDYFLELGEEVLVFKIREDETFLFSAKK